MLQRFGSGDPNTGGHTVNGSSPSESGYEIFQFCQLILKRGSMTTDFIYTESSDPETGVPTKFGSNPSVNRIMIKLRGSCHRFDQIVQIRISNCGYRQSTVPSAFVLPVGVVEGYVDVAGDSLLSVLKLPQHHLPKQKNE